MEEAKKKGQKAPYAAGLCSSTYQGSVVYRAVKRAGHCPNIQGHIFEIMWLDKFNWNIKNMLAGKRAYLTKSPTAPRDDIVVMQKGKEYLDWMASAFRIGRKNYWQKSRKDFTRLRKKSTAGNASACTKSWTC